MQDMKYAILFLTIISLLFLSYYKYTVSSIFAWDMMRTQRLNIFNT